MPRSGSSVWTGTVALARNDERHADESLVSQDSGGWAGHALQRAADLADAANGVGTMARDGNLIPRGGPFRPAGICGSMRVRWEGGRRQMSRPSRLKVAMAIALCIVLGVGALVLFFSVYGDPGLNDPVAVLENNSGTGVDVALSSCGSFEVTDVRVIAEANAYADKPGPEQVVWDLRPTDPRQRMFHLGTSDVSGGSSFASPRQRSGGRFAICLRVLTSGRVRRRGAQTVPAREAVRANAVGFRAARVWPRSDQEVLARYRPEHPLLPRRRSFGRLAPVLRAGRGLLSLPWRRRL